MPYDKVVAASVEPKLGHALPDVESDEFAELLTYLDKEDRTLADEVRSGIVNKELGDMEMTVRQHIARKRQLDRVWRTMFKAKDHNTGRWERDKTKLSVWAIAATLALFGALILITDGFEMGSLHRRIPVPEAEVTVTVPEDPYDPFVTDTSIEVPRATESPLSTAEALPGLNHVPVALAVSDTTGSSASRQAQAGPEDDPLSGQQTPEPPPAPQLEAAPEAYPVAQGGVIPPAPLAPTLTADPNAPPEGVDASTNTLMLYGAPSAEESAPAEVSSLTLYSSRPVAGSTNGAADPFEGSSSSASSEAASGKGGSLSLYRSKVPQTTGEAQLATISLYKAKPTAEVPISLFRRAQQEPATVHNPQPQTVVARAEGLDQHQPALLTAQTSPSAYPLDRSPMSTDGSASAQGGSITSIYPLGSRVDATLDTGVLALDNSPLPIVATADDDSIWFGDAVLSPSGRINITFHRAATKAGTFPVYAVAQGEDGYLGLPGKIQETSPSFASDLARGALRGVADHVQAISEQSEVTIIGNTPVVTEQAPSLELNVAGSVARLFTPPEGEDQQALVRVAQLPAQTEFKVVLLGEAIPPNQVEP